MKSPASPTKSKSKSSKRRTASKRAANQKYIDAVQKLDVQDWKHVTELVDGFVARSTYSALSSDTSGGSVKDTNTASSPDSMDVDDSIATFLTDDELDYEEGTIDDDYSSIGYDLVIVRPFLPLQLIHGLNRW
jgi:hypothetical protein